MTPAERVEAALQGRRPDRVPIVPIYDIGYVTRSLGLTERDAATASPQERIEIIERSFLLHSVDGYYVHSGTDGQWRLKHEVLEDRGDCWLVREKTSGRRFLLRSDMRVFAEDGTPVPIFATPDGASRIQSRSDLERMAVPPPTERELEATGIWGPLRHLAREYPDRHFSFQTSTPMVRALQACGGYVEGLTTLAQNRDLFRGLLDIGAQAESARMLPGACAGARSTWFTSYYTGADTISPRDYAALVFPYEQQVCQAARDAGLFVLDWFLGDLMPILDKVLELPIDALVLEQGRKGYTIDPVAIRRRSGPNFCLFGFGLENDYCEFNRSGLTREVQRQVAGAGQDGAFIAGTPIMPPNAKPAAVSFYFEEVRRLGRYE